MSWQMPVLACLDHIRFGYRDQFLADFHIRVHRMPVLGSHGAGAHEQRRTTQIGSRQCDRNVVAVQFHAMQLGLVQRHPVVVDIHLNLFNAAQLGVARNGRHLVRYAIDQLGLVFAGMGYLTSSASDLRELRDIALLINTSRFETFPIG